MLLLRAEGVWSFPHPRKPYALHWSGECFCISQSCNDRDQSGFGTNTRALDMLILIFVLFVLPCSIPWKTSHHYRAQVDHWSYLYLCSLTWAIISCLQLKCCSGTHSRSFWHAELLKILSAWAIQSHTTKQLKEKNTYESHFQQDNVKLKEKKLHTWSIFNLLFAT